MTVASAVELHTVGGATLDLTRLRPEDIQLEDIAHALSCLCRFTGHTARFFGVAEHSVLMSRATTRYPVEALLHDATEAFIGDVARPVKYRRGMGGYRSLEERIARVVAERFGTPFPMSAAVKHLDNRMLRAEIEQLMTPGSYSHSPRVKPLDTVIECWAPQRAEREFLKRARELGVS